MSLQVIDTRGDFGKWLAWVVHDSVLNLQRVTDTLPCAGDVDAAAIFRGQDRRPMDLPRAVALLRGLLDIWAHGQDSADTIHPFLIAVSAKWAERAGRPPSPEERTLSLALEVAVPLCELSDEELPPEKRVVQYVAAAFFRLGTHLSAGAAITAALGCARSAVHFHELAGDGIVALPAAKLALALTRQLDDPRPLMEELLRHAQLYSLAGDADPLWRLKAFDTWECVLRHAYLHRDLAGPPCELADKWIQAAPWLRALKPVFAALFLPADAPLMLKLPEEEDRIALRGLRPIWENVDLNTLGLYVIRTGPLAQVIENERLKLAGPIERGSAVAAWGVFNFQHHNLLRAVPHSRSILQEKHADDMLVLLTHEITHVASMLGRVGIVSWSLRWALFELEVRHWMWHADLTEENSTARYFRTRAPVVLPSDHPDGMAGAANDLARVEQQLSLTRKLQLLERIWAPWFEGIAVFAELSADPRDNALSFTVVVGAIVNLLDQRADEVVKKLGCSAEDGVRHLWSEAEERLGGAQARVGRPRLQYYLDVAWQKYLAGYCAVRSVVSAWRRTLGRPLSGDEAFGALQHATRFAEADNVPDVALPVAEFRRQLVARQIAWLQNIAAVSREDLEALLSLGITEKSGECAFHWEGRRVLRGNIPTDLASSALDLMARAREAMSGAHADPDRVAGAGSRLRSLQALTADLLQQHAAAAALVQREWIPGLLGARQILPIGRAECPYWLVPQRKAIYCLLRTREESADASGPGYNAELFPLPPQKYDDLERRVRRGAPARMTVTRLALLIEGAETSGRNFLAFQVEDWLHVENAGMMHHAPGLPPGLEETIRFRLVPNDMVASQEAVTAPDHPHVRRTLEWVKDSPWRWEEADGTYDLQPWADHVVRAAEEILHADEATDTAEITRALHEFVFGPGATAQRLATEGLNPLRDADVDLPELVRLLAASGRRPIPAGIDDAWLRGLAESGFPLLVRSTQGVDFPPPAASPSSPEEKT